MPRDHTSRLRGSPRRAGIGRPAAVVALAIMAALIFAASAGEVAGASARRTAADGVGQLAAFAADAVSRGMHERSRELQVVSRLGVVRDESRPPEARRALFDLIRRSYPHYAWLGLARADGIITAGAGGEAEGDSMLGRAAFEHGVTGAFSGPAPVGAADAGVVEIGTPVQAADGRTVGVLLATLDRRWAEELRESVVRAAGDGDGLDLAIEFADGTYLLPPSGDLATSDGERSPGRLIATRATPGYRDLPELGWRVTAWADGSASRAAASRARWRAFGAGGLVACLAAAVGWMLTWRKARMPEGATSEEAPAAIPTTSADAVDASTMLAHDASTRRGERLRLLERVTKAGVWDWDIAADTVIWSDRCYEIYGVDPTSPVTFERWLGTVHPEERSRARREVAAAIESGTDLDILLRHVSPDGSVRWVNALGAAVYEAGRPVRMVGVAINVTERQEGVAAAREATERYRLAARATNDVVRDWDLRRDCVEWNEAIGTLFGYAPETVEPTAEWWLSRVHEEDRDRLGASLHAMLSGVGNHWSETYRFRRADGAYADVLDRGHAVRDEDGRAVRMVAAMLDATSIRRAEVDLRRSEARLALAIDAAQMGTWEVDLATGAMSASERIDQILGVAPGFTGHSLEFWRERIHPEDRDRAYALFMDAVAGLREYTSEHRVVWPDGTTRWVAVGGSVLRAADGTPTKATGVATDVTERRLADEALHRHRDLLEQVVRERTLELESSHQRLRLSERMAALGTLSAGLGHDMGNLLLPVRMRLDALKEEDLSAWVRADVEAISQCAEYLQRLAAGLRLFALDPEDTLAGEATDLGRWWPDVQPFFRNGLPTAVEFIADFPPDVPPVRVARHALTQSVFNLVQNAGDALRPRGAGRVRVAARAADQGRTVELRVEDDGPGMTPEVRRRCLEPFFTTKTRGISTGLGLALVHSMVQKVDGTLVIETELGRGTAFVLRLPAARTAAETSPDEARPVVGVSLRDGRLASFAGALARATGFDVTPSGGDGDGRPIRVWLVDDPAELMHRASERLAEGRALVVYFGGGIGGFAGEGVLEVGPNPSPSVLRSVLEQAARSMTAGPRGAGRGE